MLQSLAPALGCGLMMLVCMAAMAIAGARNRRNPTDPPATTDEIAALRDEVARLRRLHDQQPDPMVERPTP